MAYSNWPQAFPAEVTVCDAEGKLIEMNEAAESLFEEDGGLGLIGANALDCHPEPARSKLARMMTLSERSSLSELHSLPQANVYITEKQGRRRLFYQAPWYQDGQYAGFVELSFEVPEDIPVFKRD